MKKDFFYVYWLSFKDGHKKLCETVFEDSCSAERAALYEMTFYSGQDVLSPDSPYYVGRYEY